LAEQGYQLEVARRPAETRALLAGRAAPVVVLDPLAAGGHVELEELERQSAADAPRGLLLVCDPESPTSALEAVRGLPNESWDLIQRDASLAEYAWRIERLIRQNRRQEELDELRYRASHDDRTELLRPRFFQARLVEHFSAAQRHGLELALVLIDLDSFGLINKVYDHTVGDLVIARVADAVRASLRAEDVAGRLGGDEFGVLLPYTSPVDAAYVVRRLRQSIRRVSERVTTRDRELEISASLGFETFDGRDLDTVASLRRHAEQALRAAKAAGGDRGVYFRLLD
jgi:diguanylate cyclase (GGDEF)-like protein